VLTKRSRYQDQLKIKAFGCSFIWGTDLSDVDQNTGSNLTWPALLAKHQGYTYKNCAIGGSGNHWIAATVAAELGEVDNDNCIYVIQWTWADRFDYIDANNRWQTLRPSLEMPHADYYYRHLQSEFRDRLSSLQAILSCITVLHAHNQPFVMTALDNSLGDRLDPQWWHPHVLDSHWNAVRAHIKWFENKDFLSWSREQGFAESALCHPLEEAHARAADYVLNQGWLQSTGSILRRA
jgi:hypothetical protein